MRMLIRIVLPTAAYNRAIAAGKLAEVWQAALKHCTPEATYYVNEQGLRAVHVVAEIESPDRIAAISLPLYEHFEAEVSFVPAMVFSDLQTGLNQTGVEPS